MIKMKDMRQNFRKSLLSILVLMLCVLTMDAADNKPTAQIGFTAPLRTTVEIMQPLKMSKYTFSESTVHMFALENYTFGGGAYFKMSVNVPTSGKTLTVYYSGNTYMTKSLEYGANLVDFFIPLTSYKTFLFYITIK